MTILDRFLLVLCGLITICTGYAWLIVICSCVLVTLQYMWSHCTSCVALKEVSTSVTSPRLDHYYQTEYDCSNNEQLASIVNETHMCTLDVINIHFTASIVEMTLLGGGGGGGQATMAYWWIRRPNRESHFEGVTSWSCPHWWLHPCPSRLCSDSKHGHCSPWNTRQLHTLLNVSMYGRSGNRGCIKMQITQITHQGADRS